MNKYFIQRFGQLEFLISKMKEEGITTEEAQLNHLGGQFIIAWLKKFLLLNCYFPDLYSFDINKMFIGFFFLHFLDSRNGRDSVTQLLYLIQLGLMYVIHKEDIKYLAVIINLTESLHCHIPYLTATKIYFSCNWKLDSYTRWTNA